MDSLTQKLTRLAMVRPETPERALSDIEWNNKVLGLSPSITKNMLPIGGEEYAVKEVTYVLQLSLRMPWEDDYFRKQAQQLIEKECARMRYSTLIYRLQCTMAAYQDFLARLSDQCPSCADEIRRFQAEAASDPHQLNEGTELS